MSNVTQGLAGELRQLPASARRAAATTSASPSSQLARRQFSRTFADVLSGRFGGRWSVDWEPAMRSTPVRDVSRSQRSFSDG
jgi:hypothetical protein